jgi:transcriptional regulator with XRE-family HTH domain
MNTSSRTHAQKLRQIRKAEGLTQSSFSEMIGIALSTVKNYESGQREAGLAIIDVILKHPRFEKYTLWLMTDKTAPVAGQIAPSLSPDGHDNTTSSRSPRKTG